MGVWNVTAMINANSESLFSMLRYYGRWISNIAVIVSIVLGWTITRPLSGRTFESNDLRGQRLGHGVGTSWVLIAVNNCGILIDYLA